MIDHTGLLSSKPELMGLSPLEALASGLPALVSDVGSFPELAADPAFCRTFSSDAELAAALREVVEGGWPAAGGGTLARRHVVREHGYDAIGGRLADFYQRVHRATVSGRAA